MSVGGKAKEEEVVVFILKSIRLALDIVDGGLIPPLSPVTLSVESDEEGTVHDVLRWVDRSLVCAPPFSHPLPPSLPVYRPSLFLVSRAELLSSRRARTLCVDNAGLPHESRHPMVPHSSLCPSSPALPLSSLCP